MLIIRMLVHLNCHRDRFTDDLIILRRVDFKSKIGKRPNKQQTQTTNLLFQKPYLILCQTR